MRLRRIIWKDGRAPVTVLHTPQPNVLDGTPENWRGKLIEHAKSIASFGPDGEELTGYIVIGLFSEGGSSVAFRLPSWLPATLAPSYLADILRRDALMEREARSVFNEMFQWVE